MKSNRAQRGILYVLMTLLLVMSSACTKSPEQVREWIRDKRAPQKMHEFIQNERFSLDSKVEALMVLIERNNIFDIETALTTPFETNEAMKPDEINRIVAGAIERMDKLLEENQNYQTKIKDAAYILVKMDSVNDENRDRLMGYITNWLSDDNNFFISIAKAGRIEQKRLLELLGKDGLPIFQKAIRHKLDQLYEALAEEDRMIAEAKAANKKIKRVVRSSDLYTQKISETLTMLHELNLEGGDDMVADLFIAEINARYPNMPKALALPFSMNESPKFLALAKKIMTDPEYKNETLNYFKNVILLTYYPKIQKKSGVAVCTELLQSDRTGYIRWDCLDILTADAGRTGLAGLLQTIPNSYDALKIPEDHPTLVAHASMNFWNSMLVYCSHLPSTLNNQVPLEVFRQLAEKGTTTITRMLSMACLSVNGTENDVAFLQGLVKDRTPLNNWGMSESMTTLGRLANYTSKTLDARIKLAAAKAAQEIEEAKKAKELDEAAKKAKSENKADSADAAATDAKSDAPAASDKAKS